MSYLGKVFESLKKKIQCFRRSKNFWCFRVLVLSYRASLKDTNNRKFRKPHFSGKLMNGCYFHRSETGHLDDEFPKYFIWTNNFLVKAVKFTWGNSLGKVRFF